MSDVKIYHNPECGTSRNTLALIQNAGIEPDVILYLEHPPTPTELKEMIQAAGLTVQAAIRTNVMPYTELDLANQSLDDETLIDLMVKHPLLINRPFVVTPLGTCLARPSERVLEILPQPQQGAFFKENGEQVIDAMGQLMQS